MNPSTTTDRYADQRVGTERALAEVLAEVARVERVPVESHFFDDLGADSLVMAHFCARLRKRADLPSVSMKDIYRYPTIRSLAAAFPEIPETNPDAHPDPKPDTAPAPASTELAVPEPSPPVSGAQYSLCGALQLLTFLGYSYLAALVTVQGYEWISASPGLLEAYLRSVAFGGVSFLGLCLLPVLAKWLLIGRWREQRIRVWSLAYVRFWIVKTLARVNPLALLAGSPLYTLYLRTLGARIGRGVVIFSRHVPVCADLLTIGDNTVIRKDAYFAGYRAHAGYIETGTIDLGENVFVGEAAVIDINTSMGDGGQLGRASALHTGQAVPAGECWHGSPAVRTEMDYQTPGRAGGSALRRALYSSLQLLALLAVSWPLMVGGVALARVGVPRLDTLLAPGQLAFRNWTFYGDALAASFVLFFGALLTRFLLAITVPRVVNRAITPGRIYPLYGFHFWAHRMIARLTNIKFFMSLFGDSSYIVHYLRCVGYELSHVEQTGSNFGTDVKHDNPHLCSVGRGTMVADGLTIINTEFSSTSFRVSRTSIGPHNFLGNHIVYPPRGRTGDNCLLATKVLVPLDGEVREGVGLLGSPSMKIPRGVARDAIFDRLRSPEARRRRLAEKNAHNLLTMGWYLLARWLHVFGLALLASSAAIFYDSWGATAVALDVVLSLVFTVGYFVLVERAATALYPVRSLFCSIYDLRFREHERFWKASAVNYLPFFDGTPFRNVINRMLGARIGRRVFDDGCFLTEKTLVTIGDGCTLNAGSKIQCHSQEDGSFKSDHSVIGAGCTIGIGALVHYGVTVGDAAVLAPDSFLMKGEEIPAHARWGGNPARDNRPL